MEGIIYNRIARVLAYVVMTIGSVVLIGWLLNIPLLKSITPQFVAMNPASAVCFILAAVSIIFLLKGTKQSQYVSFLLMFVVGVVGLLKLIEIQLGVQIGIDRILFSESVEQYAKPNRMAPNTAFNFMLLGMALLLLEIRKGWAVWCSQAIISLSIFSALLALVGYIFGYATLYGVDNYIPMAVHTAVTFLILTIIMLLVEPERGLGGFIRLYLLPKINNLRLRPRLLLGFGLLLLLLVVLSTFTIRATRDINNNQIPARTNVRDARAALLRMQLNEQLFLNREVNNSLNSAFFDEGASVIVDSWEMNYSLLGQNLKELSNFEGGDQALIDKNNVELKKLLEDYRKAFISVVEKYQKRGFKDFGEEGLMREAIAVLEGNVSSSSLYNDLLLLRRYEKDFFLRKELVYVDQFNEQMTDFKRALPAGSVNRQAADTYDDSFQNIVQLEKEIGLPNEEGLLADMESLSLRMDPLLERLETSILGGTKQSINRTNTLIILLTLLFTILGVIFAYWFAETIARSIGQVKDLALDIAKGDLDKKIDVTGNDEIADLGRVFNTMAVKLKESQDTLLREKAKDEAILAGIGDAVFAIDTDENIILFNQVAADISGYTDSEAIGRPYKEVLKFSLEDSDVIKDDFVKKAMAGVKTSMANHTVLIRKNGEKVAVADSASPIVNADDKVIGVVVVFRDVAHEREVDRAKTEFVSLASHQLRTPLSTINWYAEMLLAGDAGKLTPEQKEYLDEIYKGNQRMVDLVNALLNVSRIDLGTFAIEPQPTKLSDISDSLIKELTPKIKERQMNIVTEYDPEVPVMNVDPKLMRIVFQNLLTNAVKYTPEKGTVGLRIRKLARSVEITVKDTGYGIPQEQQGRIFTKLFRADNVREKETDGTGLGLYIVKSIIEQSKGKVWFESVENKGTIFYVTLPLSGMKVKQGTKGLS